MPVETGNKSQGGLPDSDFAGTSPALEDLMNPDKVRELIANSSNANGGAPSGNGASNSASGNGASDPEFLFVREVDRGDGTKEIFKAKTADELIDKIAEAKTHANRKILEQRNQQRAASPEDKPLFRPVEYKPQDISQAEALRIMDQWNNDPVKGFDQLIERRFGAPPAAIANGLNIMQAVYKDKLEQEATGNWANKHAGEFWQEADLIASLRKIAKKLLDGGHPITEHNLEWSYQQLVSSGELLVEEPPDAPTAPQPAPAAAPPQNGSARVSPGPPAFVASDRSGQRTEAAPQRQAGIDVNELNKMPLADMREAINRAVKAGAR
jgi:hypothetical protein